MKYLVQLHPDASATFFEDAHIDVIRHYEMMQQYLVELNEEDYSLLIQNPYVLHIERDHDDNTIL
ncbi:hypothetical protein [Macrococcoides caseolyticum]|uniref:hypothetical protein n=1 Tax=Macrococcoides caseolyticum TaxID=69966 RepID=UPI000C326C92|nr:hypothetical protein [Macrococcus caseolyticus]PKD99312.1 hypothetical protein CW719_04535 [Macrococcus caseolyticus]PKE33550.1 hypothetical protein CW668_06790 [Macrococcus caseolyticus]PKF19416.1 hypothetical protein CW717_04535 [Macrococcus caseolyticus]PKF30029.1 hypothetical protein CW697_05290 [Macrococcus caseolyticus]